MLFAKSLQLSTNGGIKNLIAIVRKSISNT